MKNIFLTIVIVLVVVAVFGWTVVFLGKDNTEENVEFEEFKEDVKSVSQEEKELGDVVDTEISEDFVEEDSKTVYSGTTNVSIPLFLDDPEKYEGELVGCSVLVMYPVSFPSTITPLKESFEYIFSREGVISDGGLKYVNPLGLQDDLFFDRVEIINKTAKVYLTGNIVGNGCVDPATQAQVERTALQFDSVDRVETYINGSLFDWQNWVSQR